MKDRPKINEGSSKNKKSFMITKYYIGIFEVKYIIFKNTYSTESSTQSRIIGG